jgi:hypothetical protein
MSSFTIMSSFRTWRAAVAALSPYCRVAGHAQ